jgi:hypothetical protein
MGAKALPYQPWVAQDKKILVPTLFNPFLYHFMPNSSTVFWVFGILLYSNLVSIAGKSMQNNCVN